MPEPRNVAGYVRLSVATEESVSVAGQTRMILAAAEARGWPTPTIFTDENVSGSNKAAQVVRRPQRDELERRVALGEFDALLCKSVDRLARSVLDFHRIADTAARRDCALVILDTGLDTSNPAGKMMLGILANFAEFEASTIGTRVRASNVTIRAEGRSRGGPVPYGFVNVGRDGRAGKFRTVDPEEAEVVRRMVDEVLAGNSFRAVARGLNHDGVPTPRARDAQLRGEDAEPAQWLYTTVKRVLANPAIAGQERALGDVVRDPDGAARTDEDAAIIDVETFRTLRAVIDKRSSGLVPRIPLADRALLDGIARCAACGGNLHRTSTRGYVSYACSNGPKDQCTARASIAAPRLDTFVVDTFLHSLGSLPHTRTEQVEDGQVSTRLTTLRAEMIDTASSFAEAPVSEIPALAARMAALRAAEGELLAEAGASPGLSVVVPTGLTWGETWEKAVDTVARRTLLAEAMSRVDVTRGRAPTEERVSVVW